MVYTKHSWREKAGTTGGGGNRETWLNNLETQYDEVVSYYTTTLHDASYYTEAEWVAMPFYNPGQDGTGSGFVAEYIDGYTAVQILGAQVATGTIIIWVNSVASIPAGWHLCDGRDGDTPDLREKYPVVAGDTYALDATGGIATVSSAASSVTIATRAITLAEMGSHEHGNITDYRDTSYGTQTCWGGGPGGDVTTVTYTGYAGSGTAHGHPGSTLNAAGGTTNNNLPASRAYCYIIKE